MHIEQILMSMRAQEVQSDAAIAAFVSGVVDGTVSRPQAAAWLAWAFSRGLTDGETVALTRNMVSTGDTLSWPDGAELVDKHSTGGVGDKVSLILAPLWAELGLRVPMVSGRGLGHTGGTLDKLEAIPGYRTDLDRDDLGRVLGDVGCFISGQTGRIAPADRTLYALRNETSTVESIPLIVASILSKKLSAGVQRLVLDVKAGSGAFMKDVDQARALATALVRVAKGAGTECSALLTAMDRPLGLTIGNALEVEESIETLKGGGPKDLVDLTVELAGHPDAARVLASGAAFERFGRMVEAQGGDRRTLDDPKKLHGGTQKGIPFLSPASGTVTAMSAWLVGRAFVLGAGRRRAEDPVDFGVGIRLHAQVGDDVVAGERLATMYGEPGAAMDEAMAMMEQALVFDGEETALPLVVERIG